MDRISLVHCLLFTKTGKRFFRLSAVTGVCRQNGRSDDVPSRQHSAGNTGQDASNECPHTAGVQHCRCTHVTDPTKQAKIDQRHTETQPEIKTLSVDRRTSVVLQKPLKSNQVVLRANWLLERQEQLTIATYTDSGMESISCRL